MPSASALALLCAPHAALAQEERPEVSAEPAETLINLDSVVVTASRARLPERAIGSAVTVVEREELERGQIRRVSEILQDIPGVRVTTTRPGAFATVSIRGSDGDQVLVLLDGIRLGDPSAINTQFNFDHLTSLDIERIEVLRGNQSSLYGSDAIGGVINIITRRAPQDGVVVNAEGEGGSYGTARGGASLFFRGGPADVRLTTFGHRFDGPSIADPETSANPVTEDDRYSAYGFSGRVGLQFTENLALDVTGFYSLTDLEYDTIPEDGDDSVAKDEFAVGARLTYDMFDGLIGHEASASIYDARREYETSFSRPGGDIYDGTLTTFGYTGTVRPLDSVTAIGGVSYEEERTEQITGFTGNFEERIDTTSVFGELAVEPLDGLSLTAAARLDDNSRFGTFDTYRLTAAYFTNVVDDLHVKLRGSFGTGANAPGLYQLFDPAFGNADLEVEESRGWDVGVDLYWDTAQLVAELTYFQNDVTDEIDFDFAQGGYIQRGETEAQGVEVGLSARPLDMLLVNTSYTWLDAEDTETGLWTGRPRHTGTTSVTVTPIAPLSLTGRARYATENGSSSSGNTDPYIVFDLLGSYQVTEAVEVFGRIENVFDAQYQESFGRQTNDFSVFGGLRVSFTVF